MSCYKGKVFFKKVSQKLQEKTCIEVTFLIKSQFSSLQNYWKRPQRRCFLVNFAKVLRAHFFNNISSGGFWRGTQKNQTTAHYILIEQLLSLIALLWTILAAHRNWQSLKFFYSRPKVKMRQNLVDNFIFVFP